MFKRFKLMVAPVGCVVLQLSCGGGSDKTITPSVVSSVEAPSDSVHEPTDQDRLLARIRAGIHRAEQGSTLPYAPPPVWKTGTVYVQGDVVRGTGADGGHQYIALASGGQSAAEGNGPSGVTHAVIQDGGVRWFYAGAVRTLSASLETPRVTWGLRTELLRNWSGFVVFEPSLPDPVAFFSGGLVESEPSIKGRSLATVRGGNIASLDAPVYQSPSTSSMTFWTDSDQIMLASINAIYARQRLVVEVNDRRIDDGQTAVNLLSGVINPGGFLINFSQSSLRGTNKKIRLRTSDGFVVTTAQVIVQSGKTIWTETDPNQWKLAVEGDSLTQGGYHSPYQPGQDWVSQVGTLLGCDDVANMAQGGTGFISDNFGQKTTYMQRIERFASLNADVYVIAGNHNDLSYPAADQIQAALRYFKKLRELQPKAVIVVFGVNPLQGESSDSGGVRNAELNLKAAFDQWADDNAYFVPIATDPNGPWITGTGSVDAPKGDGNKDLFYTSKDGHPLQRGVDYFAQRYAQALKNIFAGK